jgi:hypothetical protein
LQDHASTFTRPVRSGIARARAAIPVSPSSMEEVSRVFGCLRNDERPGERTEGIGPVRRVGARVDRQAQVLERQRAAVQDDVMEVRLPNGRRVRVDDVGMVWRYGGPTRMAPFVLRGVGALLALACSGAAVARAAPEIEDATTAAPVSCAAEQFALRSYVIALRSGDVTSGARDPARIAKAMTPVCLQAIQNGRWPGLAQELLRHVSEDVSVKPVLCDLAPPEAWSAIVAWETAGEEARFAYDLPCAVALFRHRREDFVKVVGPRLAGGGGCAFPDLAARLGEAVRPDERVPLLPTLDFATRTHAEGRDRLYGVLCQHAVARTQAACRAAAVLEPTWAHQARVRRASPRIAFHVALAALFALAACWLRYRRAKTWPALGMSVAATAATAGMVAWIVASAPAPGAGALNGLNIVLALVAAPVSGLFGALLAWAFIRAARGAALPWCLLHALIYGVVTAVHAWTSTWDRLC